MRSTMFRAGLTAVAALTAGLLAAAVPASAETVQYKAMIMPASEVPPVTNSKGMGQLAATYDSDTMMLSYTVTFDGLTGPAIMTHFHGPAPVGKNAGVMVPVSGETASPVKGSVKLTADQAKALTSGEMYFNIHTPANKGGEMRGQVEKAM